MVGNTPVGSPIRSMTAVSQPPLRKSYSPVHDAFEWSVTWMRPPLNCHTSQLSIVPKQSSPAAARSRPPHSRKTHSSLVADAMLLVNTPWLSSSATRAAVRLSCQLIAG